MLLRNLRFDPALKEFKSDNEILDVTTDMLERLASSLLLQEETRVLDIY